MLLLCFAGKETAEDQSPRYPKQIKPGDDKCPQQITMDAFGGSTESDQSGHIGNPDYQ
jgi:hypothetical protein